VEVVYDCFYDVQRRDCPLAKVLLFAQSLDPAGVASTYDSDEGDVNREEQALVTFKIPERDSESRERSEKKLSSLGNSGGDR